PPLPCDPMVCNWLPVDRTPRRLERRWHLFWYCPALYASAGARRARVHPSGPGVHYSGAAPGAGGGFAAAFLARRVALHVGPSASRLAALISAARSGASGATSRRKLAPGPCVKRCRTLLPPPGSGSIRYRHDEDGRAGSPLSSRTTHANARGRSASV